MTEVDNLYLRSAVRDFREARRKAALQDIAARLSGRSEDLLAYDEVRELLKAEGSVRRGLREIPLDAIVGSVGRYSDFTRSFLPRRDSDEERWAKIKLKTVHLGGLPPIEVYQVGEAYFVLDGNHRVSVARQLGATEIQAYVTEVKTKVPFAPGDQPDDLIIKARYAEFLERTGLDEMRPQVDLSVTAPGQYRVLEEQIDIYRRRLALREEREPAYQEAVRRWCDEVYQPTIKIIRRRNILRDFPGRTETDLYVWVSRHRAALAQELGWEVDLETAATDLAIQYSPRPQRVAARLGEKILDAVTPDDFESGPYPGQWRKEQVEPREDERLFADILTPISGDGDSWPALEQALVVAYHEQAKLHGLHVVASQADKEGEQAQAILHRFNRRCQETGIAGELMVEQGNVARLISQRARWVDLVVLDLAHRPASWPIARVGSRLRKLIRRCPRPLLIVPGEVSPLRRPLLAYDGSRKAREALFVAAYLAGCWQISLVVVTVMESDRAGLETLAQARRYLEKHGVEASFVEESGPVAETIGSAAVKHQSDLIIMGGYGFSPVLEAVLGSAVDRILRTSHRPLLICR